MAAARDISSPREDPNPDILSCILTGSEHANEAEYDRIHSANAIEQRGAPEGAANTAALKQPQNVASIFLTREQRLKQKEAVADVGGHPEPANTEGAREMERGVCGDGSTLAPKEPVNLNTVRLAPLFLPQKPRVVKERSVCKDAGLLEAGQKLKGKRVVKQKAVFMAPDVVLPPSVIGEAERELQNGEPKRPVIEGGAETAGNSERSHLLMVPGSDPSLVDGVRAEQEKVVNRKAENKEQTLGIREESLAVEMPKDAAAENEEEKSEEKRREQAGLVRGFESAGPPTPGKRKRGRPRKASLDEAPGDSKGVSKPRKAEGDTVAGTAKAVSHPKEHVPFEKMEVPSQDGPFQKQGSSVEGAGVGLQVEDQQPSGPVQGAGQKANMKVAQPSLMKVPDIFLTANERKRRLQEAKKEEKRVQEAAAAAAEQAKLEKEVLLLKAKEDKKREAEERRQRAKEEKARLAEEKKRMSREEKAKQAEEKKRKASGGVQVGEEKTEVQGEMSVQTEGASPARKKRGRPRKVKPESEAGSDVVVVLSGSEMEEARGVQSLEERMRKRQEDLRESVRESQEAHARMHAGKATHPFFKRKQGPAADEATPAAAEPLQAKDSKVTVAPLDPLHVTQSHEEHEAPVTWPERQLRTSEASTLVPASDDQARVHLLDPAEPVARPIGAAEGEGRLSLAQRQEAGLGALFDFVKARCQEDVAGGASEEVRQLTSEDAVRHRFEWYKTRAAQMRPDDREAGPVSCSPDVSGEPTSDELWCVKYRPLSSHEVCGNSDGVAFIRDWLAEWTARIASEQNKKLLTSQSPLRPKRAAKKWQASEESSDWLVSGGVSDSDLRDEEDGLANVLLLSGPTGVGKTATAYAVAKELGFHILESNPSEKRSRAMILQRFGEATESKGLLKGNSLLAGKAAARPENALLASLRRSASAKDAAGKPRKAAQPKRTSRRRATAAGNPFAANGTTPGVSESDVSAFLGSESSGGFGAREKGRKRGRKAKATRDAVGEVNRAVEVEPLSTEEGAKAGRGEFGGTTDMQPLGKRRKTVGFVGLEGSELKGTQGRASEGGPGGVPRALTGDHLASRGREDVTVSRMENAGPVSGDKGESVGDGRGALRQDGEGYVKEELEGVLAAGRQEMAVVRESTAEDEPFLPAYQQRRRGETVETGGTRIAAGVSSPGPADTLLERAIADSQAAAAPLGEANADGMGAAADKNLQETKVRAAEADDKERPAAENETAPNGDTILASNTAAVPAGSVAVPADIAVASAKLAGQKRIPDGRRRRRSSKGADGSPPAKKRRSFGSPAVLSKVRTRPCSPGGEQGPAAGNAEGPVSNGVASQEEAPVRKRVRRKRMSMEKGSKGGGEKDDLLEKGPVSAGVDGSAGDNGAEKKGPGGSKALLLFEEVEQQFEEDKGFLSAIATLAASTKRPMIVTCNDPLEIPLGCDFRKLSVDFAAPPALDLTVHACLVAASEGSPVDPWVMERLVHVTQGDLRKVLLQAQLWSREPTPTAVLADSLPPKPSKPSSNDEPASMPVSIHPPTQAEPSPANNGTSSGGGETRLNANGKCEVANGEDQSELGTCPVPLRPHCFWPAGAARELQLDAAHLALPAFAAAALPCRLAAAVAAHQTLQTLRAARVAERAAAALAAGVYAGLAAEEASAARVRKELQEAKAAAKAAEKAEAAERRKLAREAKRAARRSAEGEDGADAGLLDDLEDVPIGRLSFCGNEAEGLPKGGPPRGRRGRRRAIQEDDDVSNRAGDVDLTDGPAVEPAENSGRPEIDLRGEIEASQVDQACIVCGSTEGGDAMLLCDGGGCLGALHMYCADPPLAEVPEGDWFCADCLAGAQRIGPEIGGPGRNESGAGKERTAEAGKGEEQLTWLALDGGGPTERGLGQERMIEGTRGKERLAEEGAEREPNPAVGEGEEAASTGGGSRDTQLVEKADERLAKDRVMAEVPGGSAGKARELEGASSERLEAPGVETRGLEGWKSGGEAEASNGNPGSDDVQIDQGCEEATPANVEEAEALTRSANGEPGSKGVGLTAGEGLPPERDAHVRVDNADINADGGQGIPELDEEGAPSGAAAQVDRPTGNAEEVSPTGDVIPMTSSEVPGSPEATPSIVRDGEILFCEAGGLLPVGFAACKEPESTGLADQTLEEIAPLQADKMRRLVSVASRKAVAITAAVWGLTDDMSASELLSRAGGVEVAANATPRDELDWGVPQQAAACLAYGSLRWKVHTCQASSGLEREEIGVSGVETSRPMVDTVAESTEGGMQGRFVAGCFAGTDSEVGGTDPAGSPSKQTPESGRKSVHGSAAANPIAQDKECETALSGPRQLLAAAGDEGALCGFLCGTGFAEERAWLRLRVGASTEQKDIERGVVDATLRELSHTEALARRSAGLSCRVARMEYAGFVGKMCVLEFDRQHIEEGLRRSDRSLRPHLDLDMSGDLVAALMQSTIYGKPVGGCCT